MLPNTSTYRANAFAPQTGTRVQSGTLKVTADQVQFEADSLKGSLPLAGLKLRRGGHNDEQIFFDHPDFPGWSIYTSDEALVRDAVLSVHPLYARELRAVERSRRSIPKPVILGLGFLAVLMGLLVLLWFCKDQIAEYIAGKIPVQWEQKLGDQIFDHIKQEGKILTNSPWDGPLGQITDRLKTSALDAGYQFQFHIMRDTNVNAFAIPGGHIVILTGLLESAESGEEVAGVLAHEMAHVTRRHSIRNMVRSAGLIIAIQTALGDVSGLMGLAVEGSRYLLQQKFSRDFEREADDVGFSYLLGAQIDPQGMISFFRKMEQMAAASGMDSMERSLALFNTHPTSRERIERLAIKREEMGKKLYLDLDPWKKSN